MSTRILTGDCRTILSTLPDNSIDCVVTSPPYFGLRDYGTAAWEGGDPKCDHKQGRNGGNPHGGLVDEPTQRNRDGVGSMGGNCAKCGAIRIDSQIGLESSPQAYVAELVTIFREVRRVLKKTGTLWLNLGDSYASGGTGGASDKSRLNGGKGVGPAEKIKQGPVIARNPSVGMKHKDLIGIPWRVAFALQDDGWYLRQDIIWHKLNPMPESVRDRCTKAHEYVFLLSKSARYHYDGAAIAEKSIYSPTTTTQPERPKGFFNGKWAEPSDGSRNDGSFRAIRAMRNKRSVWSLVSRPFPGAHFATFPPKLVELCLKAGCPKGGTVMDPFGGAGTTSLVADRMGLHSVMIELNPDYAEMARWRLIDEAGMFAEVAAE